MRGAPPDANGAEYLKKGADFPVRAALPGPFSRTETAALGAPYTKLSIPTQLQPPAAIARGQTHESA
jgi:hypothetical protein